MSNGDDLVELMKLAGGPSAVLALGWWLRSQFAHVQRSSERRMAEHEHEDERRHRQNLVRFAKLNMALHIIDTDESNGGQEV